MSKVSISDQVEAAQAAALLASSIWRGQAMSGKLTQEQADAKCAAAAAAVTSLVWVQDNAQAIRDAYAAIVAETERHVRAAVEC